MTGKKVKKEQQTTTGKLVRILLVEDDEIDQIAIKRFIKREDLPYKLETAVSSSEALEKLKTSAFDVALLDYKLSDGTGLDILSKLGQTPAIILTGQGDEEIAVEAMKMGAGDYLVKDKIGMYIKLLPTIIQKVIYAHHLAQEKEVAEKARLVLIDELKKANEKLDELSRIDPLTGLSNRRDILHKLEYEKSRFERMDDPFSIILGDIDFFKKINDGFGHNCGDYILNSFADLIKKNSRKLDTAGRWGGEEFLIILPATNLSGAVRLAEKLRNNIASNPFRYKDKKLRVTMSLGVNCYDNREIIIEDLIQLADKYLYQAKKTGRNKVISH